MILTVRNQAKFMEDPSKPRLTWLERLSHFLLREPDDREELITLLAHAHEKSLLDADAFGMIKGVLSVNELLVNDVMIPRSQMDVIHAADGIERILPRVIDSGHSRFPVIGEDRDDVIGILLAKDLLHYLHHASHFNLAEILRPAIFVPESKSLNILLKEFRSTHNHLAIAVDEYGGVAGLVTIEDVIEQIVGDIEDEFDLTAEERIVLLRGQRYRVHALTEIDEFNHYFNTTLDNEHLDTIGGFVVSLFGHVPKRGEMREIDGMRFTVLKADSRRLHLLLIETLLSPSENPSSH